MKSSMPYSVFSVLLILFLLPPAVGQASTLLPDSAHSRAFDEYELLQVDRSLPAAKRQSELNVGEPRTVRMIYFLPNDRPFRQEVVDSMKVVIRRVQTFFAEQMSAHGYGDMTFRIETDAQGAPVVHRVDGQHPNNHYGSNFEMITEISEAWDLNVNIYSIIIDGGTDIGAGKRNGKNGGFAYLKVNYVWSDAHGGYAGTTAHELGHAFGLRHDFRDPSYTLSYGPGGRISSSAATFLSVHPYFNPAVSIESGDPPAVALISPTRYPAGSKSVTVGLEVSDPTGIHQVCLLTNAYKGLVSEVVACRLLAEGKTNATVEFEYDGVIPSSSWNYYGPLTTLDDPPIHPIEILAVDTDGNAEGTASGRPSKWQYILVETSPHEIAILETRPSRSVHSLAFSPDGALLAAAGENNEMVRLWDVATWKEVATLDQGESVAFSPDGTLAVGGLSRMILWNVAEREKIDTLHGTSKVLTFSSDGSLLAFSDGGNIWLWDVATWTEVATLDQSTCTSVAFSPDGAVLASSCGSAHEGVVRLWNVETQDQIATLDHDRHGFSGPTSVAFSPDGTILATGHWHWHRLVALWDVETWDLIAKLEKRGLGKVASVAFSPDGTLLAAAGGPQNNRVMIWDVLTRQEIVELPHTDPFSSVAFSPDGATLAAAASNAIILWDVGSATFTATGKVHTDFDGDGNVGFGDFLLFAAAFGLSQSDVGYEARYDLDGNGTIGFTDFLLFAEVWGLR